MVYTLVSPSTEFKNQYLEMISEYEEHTDASNVLQKNREAILQNPVEYIVKLQNEEQGINLPEGYVSCSTFWLWDGEKILGESRLRHSLEHEKLATLYGHIGYDIRPSARGNGLGTELLRLTLEKAKEMGIDKVLITCDVRNSASKRVIEKNGGVLDEEMPHVPDDDSHVARYWVEVGDSGLSD